VITSGAVPAPSPAHIGVSQISQITASQNFARLLSALLGQLAALPHAAVFE
jgi:hypothetical protein